MPIKVIIALLCCAGIWPANLAARSDNILIFAASSLTQPLQRIVTELETELGDPIRVSFAASSSLARQIDRGAPADIFISANPEWMDWLEERTRIEPRSRQDFIANRLVIVVPGGSSWSASSLNSENLRQLLAAGRMALANPDHVPAGRYAREALVNLGLWPLPGPDMVRAVNVRAALAWAERGETAGAIVYRSDARSSRKVKIGYHFPDESHSPIIYPIAIISGRARPAVTGVYQKLLSAELQAIFGRFGFLTRE